MVSRAGGWPAVIGLAALTDPRSAPVDQMPSALHEFLAEELFHDVGEVTRDGLVQLSVLATVTEPLAKFLLGARAGDVLETSVQRGLLIPSGSEYQFHPLLQAFLQRKLRERDKDSVDSIIRSVGRYLIVEGFWDEAFELLAASEAELLPELLEASLDKLLREGRTATLKRWISASEEHGLIADNRPRRGRAVVPRRHPFKGRGLGLGGRPKDAEHKSMGGEGILSGGSVGLL